MHAFMSVNMLGAVIGAPLLSIIADRTGQALEKVAEDTDRDHWLSAEESLEYGLVGKIISDASELPAG